jgi:hypothetical protein
VAGRDEYGGSNVFWYCSSSEEIWVYAGMQVESFRMRLELAVRANMNHCLRSVRRGLYDLRHTTATARERSVWRGLWSTSSRTVEPFA